MKYNVNDKLPLKALALYGTQWFVLAIAVVTTSVFVATGTPAEKLFFAQKLFAVMGITGLLQVLIGHRLPIVVGPAAVLLVGVLSALSAGASNTAIYSSIAVGGAFILLLNIGGLLRYVQRLFSARCVIVILMLIAFTLTPVIRNLIFPPTANNEEHTFGLIFTFIALPLMVMMNGRLRGVAKSLVIPIVLVLGSVAYGICFGYELNTATSASLDTLLIPHFEFDLGVMIAFLICYIALLINDIGSIESLGAMLGSKANNLCSLAKRRRGSPDQECPRFGREGCRYDGERCRGYRLRYRNRSEDGGRQGTPCSSVGEYRQVGNT